VYHIKEIFETIQGEGARTGEQSTFVRFRGCNLWSGRLDKRDVGKGACADWCDTDFADGVAYLRPTDVSASMDAVWRKRHNYSTVKTAKRWCVLSGGEPMLQVDDELVDCLHAEGWNVAVETNGTILNEAIEKVDWVCVSPKLLKDGSASELNIREGQELKVIIPGGTNGIGWSNEALQYLRWTTDFEYYFLQPQDPIEPVSLNASYLVGLLPQAETLYEANKRSCLAFIDNNPDWELSIQTHKIQGIP